VERRLDAIARAWARAAIVDVSSRAIGVLVALSGVVLVFAFAGYLATPELIVSVPWLVAVGNVVMTLAVLVLIYVGRQAYANPTFRRSVGIVWDLGTFWPRATHPLAPPCYAERTIPELLERIQACTRRGGRVILSCHSQGTVIGAAALSACSYDALERVALVTYGSPLRRLYSRFFPAYFGLDALLRLGVLLEGRPGAGPGAGEKPPPEDVERRRSWPWVNLYRRSDPIGGPVFVRYPAVKVPFSDSGEGAGDAEHSQVQAEVPEGDVDAAQDSMERAAERREPGGAEGTPQRSDIDWEFVDPRFERAEGDLSYPALLGHSDYARDPAFRAAVRIVELRRAAGVRPPRTP
jgi:hypothetical protein